MIGYGRVSTTERISVNNDSLINLNWLKIQSSPLRKLLGSIVIKLTIDISTKRKHPSSRVEVERWLLMLTTNKK